MNLPYQTKYFFIALFTGLYSTFCINSSAQELSNIGKAPLLATNGGLSFNQVYYQTDDTLSKRDPYAYTLMANLNTAIYGWSIPLSFIYSNRQWSYQQPFNQFTLSPSYKWVRLHLGYTSMNFSTNTLGGHQFLGGGIELTPDIGFKFSAMYGRLQKRIQPDSSLVGEPMYHRIGTGFKAEYTNNIGNIGVILFYAADDKNSIRFPEDSISIAPMENMCMGVSGNLTVIKGVSLGVDYSRSILTENTLSPERDNGSGNMPFYKYRESTRQFNALKTNLSYNSVIGSIGLGFERIDPGYRSLGTYYNNNDFINYTVNYAGGFFDNRISLAMSYGLQKDNLNGQKEQDNKRTVGNINLGFTPNKALNIGLFYSNFNNYTHIATTFENINTSNPYGHLDTLDFTQISENMGSNIGLTFGKKEKLSHNINLSVSYQQASQKQTDNPDQSGSKFYTAVAGYSLRYTPADITPSLMFNYSKSSMDSIETDIFGPSLSVRKTFFQKKLNLSAMVAYNLSKVNNLKQADNTIIRLSAGYNLKKVHNFDLSVINALRKNELYGSRNETTITLTYRYSFNWTPIFKKNSKTKENETVNEE